MTGQGSGVVTGQLEAPDENHLRALLREQGLVPVDIRPERITDALRASVQRTGPSRRDSAWLFSTLALLLENKVPLESAFSTLEEMAPNPRLTGVCESIRKALRSGTSLSDAMSEHDGLLSSHHKALLDAGQDSGRLDHAVLLVHKSIEARARLSRTVVSSLFYPVILLLVSVGAVWFLSTFVIPKFAETLEALGGALPLPTRITLGAGSILTVALPIAVVVVFLATALRRVLIPDALRQRMAAGALRLPVVGSLIWHAQGAVVTDIMATMIEGGADLIRTIDQARDVVTSPVLRERLESVRSEVREGTDLGESLARNRVLPPMICTIVKLGMRTGELSASLRRASELCEEVQGRITQRLLVLLEPAIVLFLACTVGWVVYSLVSGMLAMNDIGSF